MRPTLRPGVHVLRRTDRELQVGLDPRHAVVLPDEPDVATGLALLARCARREEHPPGGPLSLLEAAGLVVDSGLLLPLLPGPGAPPPTGPPPGDVAALARQAGPAAADLVARRRAATAEVVAFGADPAPAARLRDLLTGAGIRVAGPRGTDRRTGLVGLLVGVGEPDRELVDAWIRDGVPHLLVRLHEGGATLGPFVLPGSSACLRCLDAHCTDADPSWPLLVRQYADATARALPGDMPEPVDGLLAALALAWAARELASYVEGARPGTIGSTLRLDPGLTALETRLWPRHPACGCAWG